jgi:hypothetical protein
VHTLLEKFAPKGAEIVKEAGANAKKREAEPVSYSKRIMSAADNLKELAR